MSVYFFETDEAERTYIQDRLHGEKVHFVSEALTSAGQARKIAADAEIVSVFVHSHLSVDVLDELRHLKFIATRSTGFDHINLPAVESRSIPVSNVPTYGENTVAEHTFALILALTRNIHKAYARTSGGDFKLDGLEGLDLKGKTIGVVGAGRIGLHVIRIATGFGMNVLATDPCPDANAADLMGFKYVTLKELMNRSDIVTLHASYDCEETHLIGEHNIGDFKRGAILINTARGELVDTKALIAALDKGILRGAGLDVVEGEEVFSEEKQLLGSDDASPESLKMALRNLSMLRRPDLVITPHIAFNSREARERILDTTIANIQAYRAGAAQNTVHT